MEIKERYIKKYWYQIIRDQISDELEAQGYHVWVKKKSKVAFMRIFMLKKIMTNKS